MRMKQFVFRAVSGLSVVGAAACATPRQVAENISPTTPIAVVVRNDNFLDVDVFAMINGNRQRCPIGISPLSFALIEHRKFLTISRREPSCLDQDALDMLIALLGDRRPHHLVRRAFLLSAQSAVADGLFDRAETRCVAYLQYPGQSRDRANTWNGSQAP